MKPWRSTNTFGNFKRKKKLTKVNIDTNKPEGYNVTTVHHHHHSFLTAFFLFLFLKALSSLLKRDHQPAHGSARKAHVKHTGATPSVTKAMTLSVQARSFFL